MLNLFIARHGNTFDKGDDILRVGLRTNLPLSQSGKLQAKCLGDFLHNTNVTIQKIYCSELIRTQETARLAASFLPNKPDIIVSSLFNEIDYGVDDGKSEKDVLKRLGKETLRRWDEQAILPDGWHFNPEKIIQGIKDFAYALTQTTAANTTLIITSNGLARFFPHLLQSPDNFIKNNKIKLPTGSISLFNYHTDHWDCTYWGKIP